MMLSGSQKERLEGYGKMIARLEKQMEDFFELLKIVCGEVSSVVMEAYAEEKRRIG